jgi:putative drug exporter of the RND superfamily
MNFVTRWAVARPWRTVALWLVVVAVSMPLSMMLAQNLKAGGFTNPRGEGAIAQEELQRAFSEAPNSLQVVVHDPTGDVTAANAAAVAVATSFPHVTKVLDSTQNPKWLSGDRSTSLVQVEFGTDNTATQNLVDQLRTDLDESLPAGIDSHVTGAPALDYDLNIQSKEDAVKAELIAFPLLFIVLLFVFRSVGAMLVPLVLSGLALVVTQALGLLVAKVTDLSILFTNGVSLIGLAVAVDYSLFIIKRYREELADGVDYAPALHTAMRTAGRSVLLSALAVVVALSALFVPQLMVFTSIGLGGVLVTGVSLALAMTLLPAVLLLMGRRIHFGTLRARRPGRAPRPVHVASTSRPRALGVTVALVVIFGALALPMSAIRLEVPTASASILPSDMDSRQGVDLLRKDIGTEGLFPIQVVLTSTDRGRLLDAVRSAGEIADTRPESSSVQSVATLGLPDSALQQAADGDLGGLPAEASEPFEQLWTSDGDRLVARVVVLTKADPDSTEAHALIRALRSDIPAAVGDGVDTAVTGATAQGMDFDKVVVSSVPAILGIVALATFLLLTWAFRSWRLPLIALALNALVVSASLGVLTLVFQGLLDSPVNSVTPLLLFAIMFGLSMDYMVIMISRMRELYLAGVSHTEAVAGGLRKTAGLVNGAALIMVAVFASFGTAEISIVRQLGLGLATAVVLDAAVVRVMLMPAVLRVLGPKVWGRVEVTPAAEPHLDVDQVLVGVR